MAGYLWRWIKSALLHSLGPIDLWVGLIAAILGIVAHYLPEYGEMVSSILWQVPIWVVAGVLLVRFLVAPYWMSKEDQERLTQIENELISLREQEERALVTWRSGINEEHDKLAEMRRDYWSVIGVSAHSETNINDLIEQADMPSIAMEGQDFRDWQGCLSPASKELWECVCWAFFNDKNKEVDLINYLDIHTVLSNFWEKIASAACESDHVLKPYILQKYFPHQSRLLKLLLYGECFMEIELKSRSVRKPNIFKLYAEALTQGRTYEQKAVQDESPNP